VTSSQWLDIAVIGIALIAAISGWRSGALGSLMSFVGVLLGAIAGVMLAPHIVGHLSSPRARLFAALFLILALVVIGEVAGVVLGRAVRGSIRNGPIRFLDSVVGVGLQLVVVLIAAWLLGSPLTSSNQPNLAAAVQGSQVVSEVDKFAPEWLRTVPKRLSTPRTPRWPTASWWPSPGPAWSRSAGSHPPARRCWREPASSSRRTG
jgi:uncharacterized membrane protein required for colicin V production